MEFWGVEVKAGEPLSVIPDFGQTIHISQAAMGDGKKGKGNDYAPLHVKVNGKKFVMGSLSGENFPQIIFDLVFEKEFELSHDWKNGSVYFCGYIADNHFPEGEYDDSEESDEDEDAPQGITKNGKIESKVEEAKPAASKGKAAKPESSAKAKVNAVEPKKDESDEDDSEDEDMINASDDSGDSEDEDDSDDSEEDDSDDSEEDDSDDSEEDDSDDSEAEEETPKKAISGKKRLIESAIETPVAAKKAKLPEKTDGKKGGGHTATPHPSKKQGKTPANSSKSKEQTPKSDGKVSCKSCSKTFSSETGLESHTKDKHGGK